MHFSREYVFLRSTNWVQLHESCSFVSKELFSDEMRGIKFASTGRLIIHEMIFKLFNRKEIIRFSDSQQILMERFWKQKNGNCRAQWIELFFSRHLLELFHYFYEWNVIMAIQKNFRDAVCNSNLVFACERWIRIHRVIKRHISMKHIFEYCVLIFFIVVSKTKCTGNGDQQQMLLYSVLLFVEDNNWRNFWVFLCVYKDLGFNRFDGVHFLFLRSKTLDKFWVW